MTTTKLNWYTYNRLTEMLRELRENWCSSYMTNLFDNYQTTLFDISSNYLVCGNYGKNYGDTNRHELILVWIFDFQSIPSLSYEHVIKGKMNDPYKNWPCLRPACYGWCLPYLQQKIEYQFLSEVDMKRTRPKPGINPGTQRLGVLWWDMLFRSKCWTTSHC